MHKFTILSSASLLALVSLEAHAYIGPGLGLGMAATILGLFIAFILLIIGLIWLPTRRILRERKNRKENK